MGTEREIKLHVLGRAALYAILASMASTRTTNILLAIIAIFLALIALRPLITSHSVHAQSSSAMQMSIGALSAVVPQACLNSGGPSCVPTQQPNGLVLFDQATGNVWGYPMYTLSPTGAGLGFAPTFGQPTLYGTFNAPGQPMSPPSTQP
jgi:hypothetical protein